MERYGYSIRDVSRAVKNYVTSKDIKVRENGMDVRLKIYYSTPEEMYGKKQIPGINIESFIMGLPRGFQKTETYYAQNEENNQLVDRVTDNYIDVNYGYKIGFYVYYKEQCDYLEELFFRMFPRKFYLNVEDIEKKQYKLDFLQDTGLQPLNEVDDGGRIVYRRDTILATSILLKESVVESMLRPFKGITLDNLNEGFQEDMTILGG